MSDMVYAYGDDVVVQVVTDNAAAYKKAGLELMKEHEHLYWSLCAAHCIDLMFEDIGSRMSMKETMSEAQKDYKIYIQSSTPFL